MTAKDPRRKLIEVALPLEAVNAASRADKNRKTGTIRNLHKWFAPMPAPAWRALILASLVDDPEDDDVREEYLAHLLSILPADGSAPAPARVRAAINGLGLSQDLLNDVVVFDPFLGGASTLVEANRLGLEVLGADLNPVPALIGRFLTQLVPSLSQCEPVLAAPSPLLTEPRDIFLEDAGEAVALLRDRMWASLGELYPGVDGEQPSSWLWCHQIPCPNPACGVLMPLHTSNLISARKGRAAYLRHVVDEQQVRFRVVDSLEDASNATKVAGRRGEFQCPRCNALLDEQYIKERKRDLKPTPMVTVLGKVGQRRYVGSADDVSSFGLNVEAPDLDPVPLPSQGLGLRIQPYGFETYQDLFLPRQQFMLATFAEAVADFHQELLRAGTNTEYAAAIATYLGLCIGKLAHVSSKQATWRIDSRNGSSKPEAAMGQATLPMVWDFVEVNPFGGSVGDWRQIGETATRGVKAIPQSRAKGTVVRADARESTAALPSGRRVLVATDPPYFDAIGYADLSDYFYVWHRLALAGVWPDLYATSAVPRTGELVADASRHGGDALAATKYFIEGFTETFKRLIDSSDPEFPTLVVYAHQQKERAYGGLGSTGWEAMLQAMINADLSITASWPVHATNETRRRGIGANALAAYVVLCCRPRKPAAASVSRRGFLQALAQELPQSLRRLQQGAVPPVDLPQAAIGPGMAVFSRYSKVIETDGSAMTVATALALINQALDEVLAEQEGDFDSDTRFCLKWFSQYSWNEAEAGTADALARATNTSIGAVDRGGVFRARAGKAWLVRPEDVTGNWIPARDQRVSAWEVAVRLGGALVAEGVSGAARMMVNASSVVDMNAVKELAYLLFSISEKRGWSESALFFNGLATSWLDITAHAQTLRSAGPGQQASLDFFLEEAKDTNGD